MEYANVDVDKVIIKQIMPIPDEYTPMSWNPDDRQYEDWSIYGGGVSMYGLYDEDGESYVALIHTDTDSGCIDIQGRETVVGKSGRIELVKSVKCCVCKEKMEVEPIKLDKSYDFIDINKVNYACPYCGMKFNRTNGFTLFGEKFHPWSSKP